MNNCACSAQCFHKGGLVWVVVVSDELAKFLGIGYRQLITIVLDKSVVIFDKNEDKVQN
jgi:hypothetical protein